MQEDIERAGKAGIIRADGFITEAGQPSELDGKQQHAHQRQPEERRRVEDQRDERDDRIGPLALPRGGKGTGRNAQAERDHEG
ncbi:hypothetical protein D3C87_1897130 [compost metagenome]